MNVADLIEQLRRLNIGDYDVLILDPRASGYFDVDDLVVDRTTATVSLEPTKEPT